MKTFSLTDIGMCRKMNQDCFYTSELPVGNLPNLFLVADGMGGHNAGEYASKHTADTIAEVAGASTRTDPEWILEEAIQAANKELIEQAEADMSLWGMGTTVVAAVISEGWIYVANVGDSRLYLINDSIRQITRDHSYVEEMVRRGRIDRAEARKHPNKNIITRAVGAAKEIEIDFFKTCIQPGDEILLCSDGLTNMIEDEEIRRIVKGQRDPVEKAEKLIEAANQNGGKDNITVVIIDPFSDGMQTD
ncbi:MAG: Stp1/IreP family PP2C-type Ser/Thr phosphatase [Lachnospiraceae bacterium]|nr:Stp1/IreP family PP2C-type Ser/Thr phosphatase [Lachnospiraceae bacterium]